MADDGEIFEFNHARIYEIAKEQAMDEQVGSYIGRHSAVVQELAQRARELVLNNAPGIKEHFHGGYKMIMYGKSDKLKDQPMYIALQDSYVNLGFIRGTLLPDPQHLLRGTGKTGRHVKIKKAEDLNNPALAELIKAAVAERELRYSMGGLKPACFYSRERDEDEGDFQRIGQAGHRRTGAGAGRGRRW